MKKAKKLTPDEMERGMKFLTDLKIGESIPRRLVGGGDGGFYSSGTPESLITPENLVTLARESDDWVQRFSAIEELEAFIRWGTPGQKFDIQRVGDRAFKTINYESVSPPRRSPYKRFVDNDWHGY